MGINGLQCGRFLRSGRTAAAAEWRAISTDGRERRCEVVGGSRTLPAWAGRAIGIGTAHYGDGFARQRHPAGHSHAEQRQPLRQAVSSWTSPLPLPSGGDWAGSLGSCADVDYVLLHAQTNRTLSVSVTAVDESGQASQLKAQPVIGMWAASDPYGSAPGAFTPSSFNQVPFGLTRLDANILMSGNFLIGISDVRGDGRPDYRYHAHVLYADSAWPARVGVDGGVIALQGTGFSPGLGAAVGTTSATALAVSGTFMTLAVPAHADGVQNISVTDPVGGG